MENKESGTFRPIFLVLCHKFLQHQRLSAKLYIIHVEPCLLPSSARWSLTTTTKRGVAVSHECVVLLLAVSWLCVISTQYKKTPKRLDKMNLCDEMRWNNFFKVPLVLFHNSSGELTAGAWNTYKLINQLLWIIVYLYKRFQCSHFVFFFIFSILCFIISLRMRAPHSHTIHRLS